MNCLDYRRVLLAGEGETRAMHDHRMQCASCNALSAEHAAFEQDLRHALEIPVPPGLEERLLDTVSAGNKPVSPPQAGRRRFLAAAAASAGAAAVGLYTWFGRDDPLAMDCIQFVLKEEAKSIMMGAMPRAEAARILSATLPLELLERIGQLRHIGPCPFNGQTAYHVVLSVPQDKITLLIMPATRLSTRKRAVYEGFHARVIPLRNGSVGIIGANAAVVASVAGAINSWKNT